MLFLGSLSNLCATCECPVCPTDEHLHGREQRHDHAPGGLDAGAAAEPWRGPTGNSLAVYIRTAGAGEPAQYTWSFVGLTGGVVGGIQSFSGVDPANPIDVENGETTSCTAGASRRVRHPLYANERNALSTEKREDLDATKKKWPMLIAFELFVAILIFVGFVWFTR